MSEDMGNTFSGYPRMTKSRSSSVASSKVAVGIAHDDRGTVREMEKWFSDVADVRDDAAIGAQVLSFLQQHHVRSVVLGPGFSVVRTRKVSTIRSTVCVRAAPTGLGGSARSDPVPRTARGSSRARTSGRSCVVAGSHDSSGVAQPFELECHDFIFRR